jgi:hypothetical protein
VRRSVGSARTLVQSRSTASVCAVSSVPRK